MTLQERLREAGLDLSARGWRDSCGSPDCGIASNLANEAALALDAKDARIKELEGESEILAFLLGCHEINADQFYWLRKSEISHVIAALSDFMGAEASRKLDDALGRAALKEGE